MRTRIFDAYSVETLHPLDLGCVRRGRADLLVLVAFQTKRLSRREAARRQSKSHVFEKGGSNLFAEITMKDIQTGLGTFYGLGYGLPMSGLYARYFGGSLQFLTMDGWGSDVFLKLPSLDLAGDVEL